MHELPVYLEFNINKMAFPELSRVGAGELQEPGCMEPLWREPCGNPGTGTGGLTQEVPSGPRGTSPLWTSHEHGGFPLWMLETDTWWSGEAGAAVSTFGVC